MTVRPLLILAVSALAGALVSGCSSGGSSSHPTTAPAPPPAPAPTPAEIEVDAGAATGKQLSPLWHDHYDLSYSLFDYANEPGLRPLIAELRPRSWRCSVGRWEVSTFVPGGDSLDPAVLRQVEREFYRGPNHLAGADDPANYDFTYLDGQLEGLLAVGAQPFLCFDYMPFTLSSEQDPLNAANLGRTMPQFSFSNGIRTAPPADPAVYARVVGNVIRHVRGRFAGSRDFGVEYLEIGNEPDLVLADGRPLPLFWTGDASQWIATYEAIAAEVSGDSSLDSVRLGGGSFARQDAEPSPTYLDSFLSRVAAANLRLDFVSYHSYDDDAEVHRRELQEVDSAVRSFGLSPELINAEWGRALDGVDSAYSTIEHGLFRAKVMLSMQDYGVRFAHEALIRDPAPGADLLGLLSTQPAGHKPASQVYLGLGLFGDALEELSLTSPSGTYVLAGRDAASRRVVVAVIVEPGVSGSTVDIAVRDLPWGSDPYTLTRWEVTEAAGLQQVEQRSQSGELRETLGFDAGGAVGGLVVWELQR